jgi:ribosomal protein S18 acetylase RimI-like enzyme
MFSIKRVEPADIDTLIAVSRKTFHNSYFHLSKPADFEAYTSIAFESNKLLAELNDPNSFFYFALVNNQPIGYLKLNFGPAQTEFEDENAIEIERIYLLSKYQGKRYGQQLLDFAIQAATDKYLHYIWLGVWDKNPAAIRFYERNGFEIAGKHTFPFGDEKDADLLMRKELKY